MSRESRPQYELALYFPARSDSAQFVLTGGRSGVISIVFEDEFSLKRAKSLLLEDLFVNLDDPVLQEFAPVLSKLMALAPVSGFVNGDRAVFSCSPGEGTEVFLNGRSAGVIPGKDFFFRFLSQWLGPRPVNRMEKMGLLGIKMGASDALFRQ
ncbi:chalcone isomerase family protein [Pseudomonas sp. NBRC 100443]|uniref:chalcone isomerase family protein n=1 Tax=Pseudomonas sp. NBRC 100443 TaxID=1113665 RepID=UPI0024A1392F|nr:chalcone isomerase family protein [Pseudomonas sp. NBRC 100443]GLU39274.1 hypothetical protein Pssp01_33670 [Pseudomonas sp. NBRC 100443]